MSIASSFQNLKISTKVIAAFTLVGIATASLGSFAIIKAGAINAHTEELRTNWIPAMSAVDKIQYLAMEYRQKQAAFLMVVTDEERKAKMAAMHAALANVADQHKIYDPTIVLDAEQEIARTMAATWNAYVALEPELVAIHASKGQAAAAAYYTGTMLSVFNTAKTAMDVDSKFQATSAEASAEAGKDAYDAAKFWILIALGITAALGGLAGLILIFAVSKPLRTMTGVMSDLGGGKLDVAIPYVGRKDEVGQLAAATQAFKDQLATIEREFMPSTMVAAVRASSTPVMTVDRNLLVTFVNDATKALFRDKIATFRLLAPGIDPEKLVGTCIDMFHKNPSHQRQMLSEPSRLPFRTDITIGDLKLALNISAVFDAQKHYVGNVLEWNDVTDSRLNEGKLNALQVSQAIAEFNLDGTIIDVNKNFLNVLGYSLLELKGQHHSMLVDAAYRNSDDYRRLWDQLNRGETFIGKLKRIGKNGKEIWLQGSYNPILDRNGKTVRVVKLATDITAIENERVAGEQERATRAAEQALVVRSLATGLKELSSGNLVPRLEEAFAGEYEQLRQDFNATMTRLQDTMKNVLSSTSGISTGADEIAQAADDLSRRTEQNAASLEETAAALEEITATVKKTAQNAKETNIIVTGAKSAAEEGGRVVETAITAMGQIEQSSKKITDIIGVIDEIAFQTNLLALNAGVEAARAGDAGKGFAVVASEVRALAQRSSEAAREIKTLIKNSGEQVMSGVKLVDESGKALKRIVEHVIQIDILVTEMAQAAQQQSTGIEEVNVAVSQMDQVTQQNAAMVEQSTAASRNLATETAELSEIVSLFNVGAEAASSHRKAAPASPAGWVAPRAVPKAQLKTVGAGGRRAVSAVAARPAARPEAEDWQEF